MASCRLVIKSSAARELEAIGARAEQERIVGRILALTKDPRPTGCRRLSGGARYRIRQGGYRIVYEEDDTQALVTVFKIGHRRDIYPQ